MYNFKNKNLFSDDILKTNKNNNYYYDFGTDKKVEREGIQKERDVFLSSANSSSTNNQKPKDDDFLAGFNDPYGEKREKERKEKFADIRANADKRAWPSQSITDPFLEGFNQDSTEENKWTSDLFKEKGIGILNPQLPNESGHTFRDSQFESKLNPPVQRINPSPSITPAINRNLNAKNEFEHAVGDPNKEPVATQYSANPKESFIDKIFSKEVNNNIYTSKGNSYTEKSKGTIGISKSNYYYAEKDGKRYPANSLETVDEYDWNSIDENFLNGKFLDIINEANKNPTDIARVFSESIGGDLDFKLKLDEKTLYLINGVLYNKNEAGNFVWAYFLESHKYSGLFSGALAQGGSLLPSLSKMNGTARLDEEWDRRARWAGVKYYYEKNNKLPLYYYLYGDKIKY